MIRLASVGSVEFKGEYGRRAFGQPPVPATNIGHFLDQYGQDGLGVKLAGLYDVAEEGCFRRGLERVGFGTGLTSGDGAARFLRVLG